jgi:hypothetical protein
MPATPAFGEDAVLRLLQSGGEHAPLSVRINDLLR